MATVCGGFPPFAVLSAVLALALAGCSETAAGRSHAPPCPEGALDLPARADAIVGRLRSVPEGAEIVEATQARLGRICFAPRAPNGIDGQRTIVLEQALDDGEAAARLGHLLVHVRDGSPYPERTPPEADCDAIVARALDLEAVAHAFELELRRALGVRGRRLAPPFEEEYWAAPQAERVALVRRWLAGHPDGEGAVEALASGYRERCLRERARAASPAPR